MPKEVHKHDKRLLIAANEMPPLFHSHPNKDFKASDSEVIKWLAGKPEIMSYVVDLLFRKGLIFYNPETMKWQGINYEE